MSAKNSPQERDDVRIQDLFETAHKDEMLKRRLLTDPAEVAKEWGVEFGEREVEQLRKAGAFMEVADAVQRGTLYARCDPRICYPVDAWLNRRLVELVREWNPVFYPAPWDPIDPIFYPAPWDPVLYPAPEPFRRIRSGLRQRLGQRRR
jgi:hypothetical protein